MRVLPIAALMAGLAVVPCAFGADKARAPRHLTPDQAINCIKLAAAARPGNVKELEVGVDDGRTICKVELEDSQGKDWEAHVDVAASKVRLKD